MGDWFFLIWIIVMLWALHSIGNDIHDAVEYQEEEEENDGESKSNKTEEEV